MNISTTVAALLAAAVGLTVGATPTFAVEGPQRVPAASDAVAQQVAAAVSPEMKEQDQPVTPTGTGSFSSFGTADVTIPRTAAGQATASKTTDTGRYTIRVGTGSTSSTAGVRATDGSVVYDQPGTTDRTIQATEDGFRIHTVIDSASAPTEYVHPVSLPPGMRLALESQIPTDEEEPGPLDAGLQTGIYIVDADDNLIGGFGSPWAKDANGAPVETHFEIRGSSIIQMVDHPQTGVAYPVVADPYLGFDMIKKSVWEYYSGHGWILRVTPTGWSRAMAGAYLAGVYGWRELYKKRRNSGLNTNLNGMRDQYICHQQFVAVRAPRRATWNLDEWRRNVSYLGLPA